MNSVRKVLATLTLLLVWCTLGPVVGVLGMIYTLVVRDITRFYWTGMGVVRLGLRAAGVRVRVLGLDNVPTTQSCIFMCNHVSNMDPPVLMPIIPGRSSVLLKKGLMSIPILGTAMRMAGFIPIERGNTAMPRREAAQASVTAAGKALASGLHIVVFPEGTRSADGRLSTFKKGPFFLAMQTGAPIIPVAMAGTERMMPKGTALVAPGVVTVQMLPAIHPADYASRDELMQAVRASIANALPAPMQPII